MFDLSSMSTLAEKQQRLIARYQTIEDAHERLSAIVARGKKWPTLAEGQRTEANRVHGCSSRVWLIGRVERGHCHFQMDAESALVKGLVALLCELYDGASAAEVECIEPEIITALGLERQLSPTRLNGLASVRATMRAFAERELAS